MAGQARRIVTALVVAAAALAVGAGSASAFSTVTMFSESGDWVGGGVERFYHPANAEITLSGTPAGVAVGVSGGNRGDAFSLTFAPPRDDELEAGRMYTGAQRSSFREAGRPGIDISGDGRGCNTIEGSFEVRDLATGSDGRVVRLWVVYEQHCEGGNPALFGEVRYGYAPPVGPAAIPTMIRWPSSDVPGRSPVEPVTLLAWSSATTVRDVSLVGADAGSFAIGADECSDVSLAAGSACQGWTRFAPSAPGTREAGLNFQRADGITQATLQGHARGGRTRVSLVSDPGDYIGGGRVYEYTTANARIAAGGTRNHVWFDIDGDDGGWWSADLEARSGDILAAGRTYTGATRYPFNNGGNGLDFSGSGRGCNRLTGQFTVDEARYSTEGELLSFSARFEQHCEGAAPALRGTLEYRAGNTTPPPPWEEPVEVAPWTAPPDRDAAPGAPPYDAATAPRISDAPAGARSQASAPARADAAPAATAPVRLSTQGRRLCAPALRRRGVRLRVGTRRADRLRAGRRTDVLAAGPGADSVSAGGGSDCVDGGSGADRIRGGSGADVLVGGPGNDRLEGGTGRDRLDCGPGRDVAVAGPGDRTRGCERVRRARR
jgi:hypothetical protein